MFDYLDANQNVILFGVSIISIMEEWSGFTLLVKQENQPSFKIVIDEPDDSNKYEQVSMADFYEKVAGLKGLVTMKKLQECAFRKY